jgi:lysophospholipase L1-like esterase
VVLAACLVLAVSGCKNVLEPPNPTGGHLFDRYVAFGNSITAGFQSAGINDSTQQESYAAVFAQMAGTTFNQPLLAPPGCPPPVVNIFTGEVVGGASAPACALRDRAIPPVLNDVAVPGAAVIDPLTNLSDSSRANTLTTLMLGGRTQFEAAREADPTFVTVWIGNNDALDAALSGDTTLLTPQATFASRYQALADSIARLPSLEGAALIGVGYVKYVPNLSLGAAYWLAKQQNQLPPTFQVSNDCAPSAYGGVGEEARVPFAYGFGVLMAAAMQGQVVTLDCVNDPPVLNPAEVAVVQATVDAYDVTIRQIAQEHNWVYLDPNGLLLDQLQKGNIPPFPNTTGTAALDQPFGPMFSKDGVHPSTEAHRIIAQALASAVASRYKTTLPNQ